VNFCSDGHDIQGKVFRISQIYLLLYFNRSIMSLHVIYISEDCSKAFEPLGHVYLIESSRCMNIMTDTIMWRSIICRSFANICCIASHWCPFH
jgi:hypothetical protein